jgi:hypothetical protein
MIPLVLLIHKPFVWIELMLLDVVVEIQANVAVLYGHTEFIHITGV